MKANVRLGALLLVTSACGNDVGLDLDVQRDGDPDPPAITSIGGPEWSDTSLGTGQGQAEDVAWASDGALFVSTRTWSTADLDTTRHYGALARVDAEGSRSWTVESDETRFGVLAAMPSAGVVAAVHFDAPGADPIPPAGLDWYDADGALTDSWRLEATGDSDALRVITALLVLPDGTALWAGTTMAADFTEIRVAGRLDPEHRPAWMVEIDPDGLEGMMAPTAMALAPDGGILLHGGYRSQPPSDLEGSTASYVLRLEADGSQSWRQTLGGSAEGHGLSVSSSGHLVIAGNFDQQMIAGDIVLAGEPFRHHMFVAELDADGQVLGASPLEVPEAIARPENDVMLSDMTVAGETVVMTGMYYSTLVDEGIGGVWVGLHDLDGNLLDERRTAVVEGNATPYGPTAIAVGADGRVGIAGSFAGTADFGEGAVSSGYDDPILPWNRPYVVAYEAVDPEID